MVKSTKQDTRYVRLKLDKHDNGAYTDKNRYTNHDITVLTIPIRINNYL